MINLSMKGYDMTTAKTDLKEVEKKEYSVTDLMGKLETALADVKSKGTELDKAQAELNKAQTEYSNSMAEAEKLRAEFNTRVGNLLGDSRVRIAS